MMVSSLDFDLLYRSSIADVYYSFTEIIYNYKLQLIYSGATSMSTKKWKKFSLAIWWNDACSQLLLKKRLGFKIFIKNPSFTNYTNYKIVCKSVKRELFLIKQNAFRDFAPTLT